MVADAWNDVRNDDALGSASRVVPVWRVVDGRTNRIAEVVDLASDDEDRVAYMDVDANIIDGATHQSGTARSTY